MPERDSWTREELEESVRIYVHFREQELNGKSVNKSARYKELAKRFGRRPSAFERRMSNISYIYSLMGRRWVKGLKPASHVGANVAKQLEEIIHKVEGRASLPVAEFQAEVDAQFQKRQLAKKARSGKGTLPPPAGNKKPEVKETRTISYVRDPAVVDWVLAEADGVCENCGAKAPFIKENGMLFLEVHHVRELADDGSDMVSNAVAVCPNCHRELHYGRNKDQLANSLYGRVGRLIKE